MWAAVGISGLGGHVLEPGGELIADVNLAGAGASAKREFAGRDGAAVPAPEVHPVRATPAEPVLRALVDLEVVGEDGRGGAVDDVGERDGVAEHLLRRALEPERVGVDDGAIDGDRVDDAQLTELAHEGAVRIDDAVPAQLAEHTRGTFSSDAPLQPR